MREHVERQVPDSVARAVGEPEPSTEPLGRLAIAARAQPHRACRPARDLDFDDLPVRGHAAERPALRIPDVAIGADGNIDRRAVGARDRELGDLAVQRDPADPVAVGREAVHSPRELDEPHVPVGTGRDVAGPRVRSRQVELGDLAVRRDAADLSGVELGEPDVAVGTGRERPRAAVRRRNVELGDLAARRDAPDLARGEHAEPDIAVGPERDRARLAVGRGDLELRDLAVRRDAADAVAGVLGEPHVAVRAERDDAGSAAGMRQLVDSKPAAVGIHSADRVARGEREPDRAVGGERDCRRAARVVRQRKDDELAGRLQPLVGIEPARAVCVRVNDRHRQGSSQDKGFDLHAQAPCRFARRILAERIRAFGTRARRREIARARPSRTRSVLAGAFAARCATL